MLPLYKCEVFERMDRQQLSIFKLVSLYQSVPCKHSHYEDCTHVALGYQIKDGRKLKITD